MTARLTRGVAIVTALGLLSSGCGARSTLTPGPAGSIAGTSGPPLVTPAFSPSTARSEAQGPQLMILGDGVAGGLGLWGFEAPNRWTALVPVPTATGIARFGNELAISSSRSVDLRSARTPATPGTSLPVNWQAGAPTRTIVSAARSPAGNVAVVTLDGETQGYWLVAANGSVEALLPAPSQPFTPLVAWLDDVRLLVLSTDVDQFSRLAIIDIEARTIQPSKAIAGVRFFAVSPDRRTLAAVTEAEVFAGPLEAFLGSDRPPVVAPIEPTTVVWGLAFDDSGTRLALLSGAVAPDGHVTVIRERGYEKGPASWTSSFDSPAPFDRAIDQVWVP